MKKYSYIHNEINQIKPKAIWRLLEVINTPLT